jgi:hypothetical protein
VSNFSGCQVPDEPHPIDVAWQEFFVAALCPGASAQTHPAPFPTPGITASGQPGR